MNNEHHLLAACYKNSLQLAVANDCRSIAFPAISCGAYGFPINEAAMIAIRTTRQFLETDTTIKLVYFACASNDVKDALATAAQELR